MLSRQSSMEFSPRGMVVARRSNERGPVGPISGVLTGGLALKTAVQDVRRLQGYGSPPDARPLSLKAYPDRLAGYLSVDVPQTDVDPAYHAEADSTVHLPHLPPHGPDVLGVLIHDYGLDDPDEPSGVMFRPSEERVAAHAFVGFDGDDAELPPKLIPKPTKYGLKRRSSPPSHINLLETHPQGAPERAVQLLSDVRERAAASRRPSMLLSPQ